MTKSNFKAGDKVRVVRGTFGDYFKTGDILTVLGVTVGGSLEVASLDGLKIGCDSWDAARFELYKPTPAEEAGLKIGAKYEVVQSGNFSVGDIVVFHNDDGTDIPFFRRDGTKDDVHCTRISKVVPFVEKKIPAGNTDFSIDQIGGATTIRVQRELTASELQAIVRILKNESVR